MFVVVVVGGEAESRQTDRQTDRPLWSFFVRFKTLASSLDFKATWFFLIG